MLAEAIAPAASVGKDVLSIVVQQLAYPAVGLVLALVTYLTHYFQKKLAADEKKTSLEWAILKLTEFTDVGVGKLWAAMKDDVQQVFADGEITSEEIAFLTAEAQKHLKEMFDAGTLEKLAQSLGIPTDNLGAWVAGYIVRRFFPSMVAQSQSKPEQAAGGQG